jgi:uncharacterized YigZ family protein
VLHLKSDIYYTITAPTKGQFKDKGSKFLSYACPVHNEDETKKYLDELKKSHFNARHHCFAYILGAEKANHRISDDGEPSGTAGKPILRQIQSKNLTNIMVVVIRYFGGTLLGTNGLINAYKQATISALENSNIIEKTVNHIYRLNFEYLVMNDIMKIIKENSVIQLAHNFDTNCILDISVRQLHSDLLIKKLSTIKNINIQLVTIE